MAWCLGAINHYLSQCWPRSMPPYLGRNQLTHWGRVTPICINGSDNGLSPGRRQAIIWTNAGMMLIGPLGTNFSDWNLYIFIKENAFENAVWKMAAILSRPQCVEKKHVSKRDYRNLLQLYIIENHTSLYNCMRLSLCNGNPIVIWHCQQPLNFREIRNYSLKQS